MTSSQNRWTTEKTKFVPLLKRQSTSELDQSRIVHLSRSDAAKVGAARVGIGGIKTRMIEDVEGFKAELKIHPLPSLDEMEVFVESDVGFVHAADSDVAPASRISADKISEVLVDAILDGIAGRRFVVVAREVLDASPSRNGGKVRVLVCEREELAGVEPLIERLLIIGKSGIFASEK